ncbi:MAG TPA: hypothetical protein VG326_00925 [Tepidisphaeraceae bacterium]|jgi:hypothetical protein|nr:hypothetical protein [Tepidisphaeraceae bacterium]
MTGAKLFGAATAFVEPFVAAFTESLRAVLVASKATAVVHFETLRPVRSAIETFMTTGAEAFGSRIFMKAPTHGRAVLTGSVARGMFFAIAMFGSFSIGTVIQTFRRPAFMGRPRRLVRLLIALMMGAPAMFGGGAGAMPPAWVFPRISIAMSAVCFRALHTVGAVSRGR